MHGQSKDALAKTQLGAWEYDIVGPWYKCNMTDIMAGIGLAQMKRYPTMLERRKEIIGKYDEAFKSLGIEVLPQYTETYQSSGHLYITRIPGITLEQRQEIIIKMAEAGIACNVHYKPFSSFSFHAVKNLTTAEGGALTWRSIPGIDDEEIYHKVQLLSLHGQSKDALAKM